MDQKTIAITEEEANLIKENVVLNMFDRDFSKPFDQNLFEKVNAAYKKLKGADLINY